MAAMDVKNGKISNRYLKLLTTTVVEKLNHKIDSQWFSPDINALFTAMEEDNSYVEITDVAKIIKIVTEKTGDHRISFEYGLQLSLNRHGFLGYAINSARTLRDCISIQVKYLKSLLPFVSCDLEEYDSFFNSNLYLAIDCNLIPYAMEVILAGSRAHLEPTVPAQLLAFAYANLNYPRPAHGDLYERYIPFTLRFGQLNNGFTSNAAVLNIINPNYDPVLNALTLEQLEVRAAKEKCVFGAVKLYIKHNLNNTPTIEEAAARLHMSSRTLKRRLALSGMTFSELLAHARLNAAIDYLQSTTLTVEEIAYRLGYSHGSSFISAFKRQHGVTPTGWAQKMKTASTQQQSKIMTP